MAIDKVHLGSLLAVVDIAKYEREVLRKGAPVDLEKIVVAYGAYTRALERLAEAVREAIS